MKPKTLILMVVAIGCGLAASYMTSRVIADRNKPAGEAEKVTILVATKNVPFGTLLKEPEQWFSPKEMTKGEEPSRAIKDYAELKDRVVNKIVNVEQWVSQDDLLDKDKGGLPVPEGMRAMGVKVTVDGGVSGFALPNSRVDVLSVVRRGDQSYSKILLQNVLVLAVGTTGVRPDDKQTIVDSTVTLAVTPEQAEKLGMAADLGTLKLILRKIGDAQIAKTGGARAQDIGKGQPGDGTAAPETEEAATGTPPPLRTNLELPLTQATPGSAPAPEKPEEAKPPEPTKFVQVIRNGATETTATFLLDEDGNLVGAQIEKSAPDSAAPTRKAPAKLPGALAPSK